MPKLKTNKGVAKRFRLTAKGKVKRKHSGLRHILTTKTTKQKRRLRKGGYVSDADAHMIKKMLHG